MSQVTLIVPSISCGHCVQTIEHALRTLAGVEQVAVQLRSKQVQVVYSESVISIDQMQAVLSEEGYPVTSVEGKPEVELLALTASGSGCACCAG